MAIVDLVMPKMGESIMEATVLKWHKQPGDHVKMDETLLDIATDKVDSEVPSTAAGVIVELLYKVNDVVPVGAVIVKIETGGGAAVAAAPAPQAAQPSAPVAAAMPQYVPAATTQQGGAGSKFYSPLVLNIAGAEGVSMAELERIPGTGNEGRVTKKDILNYVANRAAAPVAAPIAAAVVAPAPAPQPAVAAAPAPPPPAPA